VPWFVDRYMPSRQMRGGLAGAGTATVPWGHRITRPPTPPLGVESPPLPSLINQINFMQTAGPTGCVVHSRGRYFVQHEISAP
jgi:hypothetical protein